MLFRLSHFCLAVALFQTACWNDLKNKDKERQAILSRLEEHSGLDLHNLDVNTTAVTFDKKMAYATVFFHPKNDSKVDGGMTMKYTLADRDGKWVVVNVADSRGHGLAGGAPAATDSLPPGHPQVQ